MIRPPPISPLFPHPTLFRSRADGAGPPQDPAVDQSRGAREKPRARAGDPRASSRLFSRSEEHTSELQSRPHLVCRLLLEKKKKIKKTVNVSVASMQSSKCHE